MFDLFKKEEDLNWEKRYEDERRRTIVTFELTKSGETSLILLESIEKLILEDKSLITLLTRLRKPDQELTANITREFLKELNGKLSSASQLTRTLLGLIPYDNPNTTSYQNQLFLVKEQRTVLPKEEE